MLHKESVQSFLENVLHALMELPELNDFRLVGGTALALQIGHRRSIDIDLFSDKYKTNYHFEQLFQQIKNTLHYSVKPDTINEKGLRCIVTDADTEIKVDIYKWPNPFLLPAVTEEKIRMAHLDDIVAMKMEALNDRRNFRDYFDIAFLSEKYTLSMMFDLYSQRTLDKDITGIIKALSNPDDLVKDQELHQLIKINEAGLKEKINYMLFVYAKEQEMKKKN